MAEISICFDGNKVTAICDDGTKAEGTLGVQFSIVCEGKTIYITAPSSAAGSTVYYSVGTTGTSSLGTDVITDPAGRCISLTT